MIGETEIVFENDMIKISKTNQNYDLIGVIDNKTSTNLEIVFEGFENFELFNILISANDRIALTGIDGIEQLKELEKENFRIEKIEEV